MQLLTIRHGTAKDSAEGVDDASRALTKAGKKDIKEVSTGLKTLVESLDVIASSPLLRAQQTAEIVAKAYDDPPIQTVDALVPGHDPGELGEWLAGNASVVSIAVVGHEPHLGILVTWLMAGARNSRGELSKGGAALIDFSSRVSPGRGILA